MHVGVPGEMGGLEDGNGEKRGNLEGNREGWR